MNLRGINYMASVGSCSCLPNMDALYILTTDLTGGCLAFVTHGCFPSFDYIVEYHKCYRCKFTSAIWPQARETCNRLQSSHLVVIDDSREQYAVSVYLQPYKYSKNNLFWTAGTRPAVDDPNAFFWEPYPGQNRTIVNYNWDALPSVASGLTDPAKNCIAYNSQSATWFNNHCSSAFLILCEIDMEI
ncbi:hypothetical protein HELRODRAFT_177701 [Helobdella robusta]|uniref:C-type lectin domain-containing protein n=1 Tax=Helobdella robusta TaxID=6412 RepID=T1FC37_HELRO|nr:hypothetical protein HELRODRAFT_177701 [Helobdella robusta]ESN97646.1 hypothetical protein HELRODRAFT_177701 [Helobdella robusta]